MAGLVNQCLYKDQFNGSEARCTLPLHHLCHHVLGAKGINPLTLSQELAWHQEVELRVKIALEEERQTLIRTIAARSCFGGFGADT